MNIPSFLGNCVPYSLQACEAAVERHDLKRGGNGYKFVGDYGTKGCYAYESGDWANLAFYGTGGSVKEMKEQLTNDKKNRFRPIGYDCSLTGDFILRSNSFGSH